MIPPSYQYNQPMQYYDNPSRQSDVLAKLMQEISSSRVKSHNNEDMASRLENLELKNMQLKREIKEDKLRFNSQQIRPPPPMYSPPFQPSPIPQFPGYSMMQPPQQPDQDYEALKEKKKRKKLDKKRQKKNKKDKKKHKERKRRRKERERIRKQNPDISFSSSGDSDLDSSSDDSALDEEERNKKQIDKMIKETDKDGNYKHVRDLDKLKESMAKDPYFKSDLFNKLGIPKFDKDEELKVDMPEDDEDFKKLEDDRNRRAMRLAEHNKMSELVNAVNTNRPKGARLKGKARFAVLARSIYEMVHLLSMIRQKEKNKRHESINHFREGLMLYLDVGKAWFIKSIKIPLMSLLQDQKINLNFIDATNTSKIDNCFIKAKVRVEAVLDSLIKNTTADDVPYPLIMFLDQMT